MSYEIITGDCLDWMRGREDSSVDLIATDPPYYKVANEPWDHQWDNPAEFLKWVGLLVAEWQRILKPNGSLYCFASPQMAGRVECVIRERLNVLNVITWNKGESRKGAAGSGVDVTALRRFWSSSSERIVFAEQYGANSLPAIMKKRRIAAGLSYSKAGEALGCDGRLVDKWETQRGERDSCEPTFEQFRDAMTLYCYECDDIVREYEDLRRPFNVTADVEWGDVWTFNPPKSRSHPCEKPLSIMRHIIKASSKPDAVVLDCFLGSGATAEAAIMEGRNFIGIEINPEYADIARERCAKAERQPDLFVRQPKPTQGSLLDTAGNPCGMSAGLSRAPQDLAEESEEESDG